MKEGRMIEQEISTWEYLASTLTQPHQMLIKLEILEKVKSMKYKLSKADQ